VATINGTNGNDVLKGTDQGDTINGLDGDDVITAGDGFDVVNGGAGDDVIHGGGDNDVLNGGDGADTILVDTLGSNGVNNTTVNGGSGGNDCDTLDVTGLIDQGFEIVHLVKNPENEGAPGFHGQIRLYSPDTEQWANVNFTDIERVIPCFTPGTMILTAEGERPVESLRPGDRIITRDDGIQKLRWVGRRTLSGEEVSADDSLRPVRIAAGALGQGLPERDMEVSPQHRMLIAGSDAALFFETPEVLAAACHLVDRPGIARAEPGRPVTYIHLMFDRHELVLSNGSWSESFQPGDHSLAGLDTPQRAELLALFPELAEAEGRAGYGAARRVLKRHEAALLAD